MSRTFNNVLDKHEMVCYYVPTRHICCIGGEQRMKISVLKIETLLAEKSMTKADLANRCGISRQNVSTLIRRGTCEPRTAGTLASGLGVEVREIIEKEAT